MRPEAATARVQPGSHDFVKSPDRLKTPHARCELGVRLATDDAGYASLRHIVALAPDMIKIDRDLAADVDSDRARRALVLPVVMYALEIDTTTVIAEGVRTREELDALKLLGVEAAQGCLIGRRTAEAVAVRVADRDARTLPYPTSMVRTVSNARTAFPAEVAVRAVRGVGPTDVDPAWVPGLSQIKPADRQGRAGDEELSQHRPRIASGRASGRLAGARGGTALRTEHVAAPSGRILRADRPVRGSGRPGPTPIVSARGSFHGPDSYGVTGSYLGVPGLRVATAGTSRGMSDSAQEKVTEEQAIPPVPGHQGGPPPLHGADEPGGDREGDEAVSSQPHHVEPRAGRDK